MKFFRPHLCELENEQRRKGAEELSPVPLFPFSPPPICNGPVPTGAPWFSVKNAASKDEPVEILIYGTIGKDYYDSTGVGAEEFATALNEIPKTATILLRIHSPGGSVWDGLAIYHMILARRENVIAQIDGVAFSAASFIAMAAGKVRMPSTGRMMIHDASGITYGNAEEMRKLADLLDQESDNIANIYAKKTGKTAKKIRQLMQEETWMTGTEAKAQGFADEVTDAKVENCNFDLSVFRRVPDSLGNPPNQNSAPAHAPEAGAPPNSPAPVLTNVATPLMKRETLISVLNKHGIKFEATATDEQLVALVDTIPATPPIASHTAPPSHPVAAVDPSVLILTNELATIRAERNAEKKLRVEAAVKAAVDAGQITATSAPSWTTRAIADETVLNDLRSLPVYAPGAEPLSGNVQNLGNSFIENYRKMKVGKERNAFRVANHTDLVQVTRSLVRGPQNANTIDATLVPDYLADAVVTVLNDRLASLGAFSRDFGTAPMKPLAKVQVAKATAGATTQTNATDFESGNSTLDNIEVVVAQLTQSFHLVNSQLNQGFQLSQVAAVNAHAFANAISDVWTALLLVANYGATTTIGSAANFDSADLPAIWALAKNYNQRNLVLDGGHIARLTPADKTKFALGESGAFGFDGLTMQNRWTGAVANSAGFVCDPSAMAVASGLPVSQPSSEFISLSTTQLADLGLTIQTCTWYARQSRTIWASYDIMFGAAAGDTTAGECLVTA